MLQIIIQKHHLIPDGKYHISNVNLYSYSSGKSFKIKPAPDMEIELDITSPHIKGIVINDVTFISETLLKGVEVDYSFKRYLK